MTPLEQKQKNRFALLQKLYEKTNGVAERHIIDIRSLGGEIGMDPEIAINTFQYLSDEGLAKWMALGGRGTISHWGVKEVEEAQEEKPTAHFPANIVMITGSPGAQVVQGSGNTVTSTTTITTGDAVDHLRQKLESVGTPLPTEAETVLAEAAKGQDAKFTLPAMVAALAAKGREWKEAMVEFANEVGPGVSSGMIVEFVKYGLGMG